MVRRWSQLSNIEKFDAYTRWSLYGLILVMPAILLNWIGEQRTDRGSLREAFWLTVLAYTIACLVVAWQAIGRHRVTGRLHRALASGAVVVLCAASIALAVATWPAPTANTLGRQWVIITCVGFALATATLQLSVRVVFALTVVAVAAVVALIAGGDITRAISTAIGTFFGFASAVVAIRASVAMLELMYRIDRAREVESQLAVAEERLRFARDLHDTLGHNLAAIALKSQVARAQISRDPQAAGAEVDAVRTIADESLSQMRAVVRGYRNVDLVAEISGARALLTSAGIQCTVTGTAHANELAWVVREGVTNVIRHSNARRCTIDVGSADGVATVRIWNDGARPGRGEGSGISGLRSRLAGAGGTLQATRPRAGEFELVATVASGAESSSETVDGESVSSSAGEGRAK